MMFPSETMTIQRLIWIALLAVAWTLSSCNPFAPGLDESAGDSEGLLSDQRQPEGVFHNLKYAYTVRDTLLYGQLFDGNFVFLYRDYDRGVDVTWGRDEELRTAYGLFQNVQRLDLVWNDTSAWLMNPDSTELMINRSFNLTVTFNPSDIVRIDGNANLQLGRAGVRDPWMIVRWRDESNF
jgi:hypothetical protein